MRRFTLTVGGSDVVGARDLTIEDQSEFNSDKGDNEAVGRAIRMSAGPYRVRFELLAPDANVESGYCTELAATGKIISVGFDLDESG